MMNAVLMLQDDSRLILHGVGFGVELLDEFLFALVCIFLAVFDLVRNFICVNSPPKIERNGVNLNLY